MTNGKNKPSLGKKLNISILFIIILLAVLNIQMVGFSRNISKLSDTIPSYVTGRVVSDENVVDNEPELNELDNLPDVLAIVDGYEIQKSEVAEIISQVELQGGFVSVEEILDQMILIKLLVQEAEQRGHSVTTKDVEEAFTEQGISPEIIREQILTQGMDYEEFLESQIDDVTLMKLIEEESKNFDISEEEALTFFESEKQLFEENATFEEYKEEIIEYLSSQRAQETVLALGEELREEANIELFI